MVKRYLTYFIWKRFLYNLACARYLSVTHYPLQADDNNETFSMSIAKSEAKGDCGNVFGKLFKALWQYSSAIMAQCRKTPALNKRERIS